MSDTKVRVNFTPFFVPAVLNYPSVQKPTETEALGCVQPEAEQQLSNESISSRERRSSAAPRSVRRLSHILRQFIKKFQTKGKQKWQPGLIFISTGRHILQIRIK